MPGFSHEDAENAFTSCRLAGCNGNPYGVKNEESEYHPDIFVCGGPRLPWPELWEEYELLGESAGLLRRRGDFRGQDLT